MLSQFLDGELGKWLIFEVCKSIAKGCLFYLAAKADGLSSFNQYLRYKINSKVIGHPLKQDDENG